MSGEAVFIIISILLIIAYTWYMMWTVVKRNRLLRQLTQLIKDAESAEQKDDAHPESR